ncbi:MAG: methyl-accepting chemotaxis protein [Eubacterium sp.]|nr:methyl-accepting chemotaxis protein [Eubacterium sp.]
MKFKHIGTRMMVCILPLIIIAFAIVTVFAVLQASSISETQSGNWLDAQAESTKNDIQADLDSIMASANSLAQSVAATYKTADIKNYEQLIVGIAGMDDSISGSGIWFAPYVFDKKQQYMGPYAYKDGEDTVITYDYSNAEYDYFSQEYYTKASEGYDAFITDPYYDDTSGTVMATCAAPMYTTDGEYLGCVTVDIVLTTIQQMISELTIGESGYTMLLDSTGIYLAGVDEETIASAVNITEDTNESLASAGAEILANETGGCLYSDGIQYVMHYSTLSTGWKIISVIPRSEIDGPVNTLRTSMIIVAVIAVLLCVIVIVLQVRSISKSLNNVRAFAGELASGNLTVDPLAISSADELGTMGDSLNGMYQSNQAMISSIADHSGKISSAGSTLNHSAIKLHDQFENIETYICQINEAMMTASAATEEVNASVEEVNSQINLLQAETTSSKEMAKDIETRALEIGEKSRASYDTATELSNKFSSQLTTAIENAKVVEEIGNMANVISEIAGQINLLSLNASIEAARAGEAGKGFAVVATEIGSLANDTSSAVTKIQETIESVYSAFDELTTESKELLGFLTETVTPDYDNFVHVAEKYGEDANSIARMSDSLAEMTDAIQSTINEVTYAITSIAESSQDTADSSSHVMDAVNDVGDDVRNVSDLSDQQLKISDELSDIVGQFTL